MHRIVGSILTCIGTCLFACMMLMQPVIASQTDPKHIPLNQYGIRSTNPFVVNRFIRDGKSIDKIIVPSRPEPPQGFSRVIAAIPESDPAAGTNSISNIPALTWCFGCSATAAAMMFGHYDNAGYPDMYTGPTNGGVFPMTNADWGTVVINGETRALCPLSATHLGLDGRTIRGHVDDYWVKYGSSLSDPFIGNWEQHIYGECTADYMGTNQSRLHNIDGSTTFYIYTNGTPLYDYTGEWDERDGCHGMRDFAESRGYDVATNFSQYIYGHDGNTKGFSFADFKTEIDAGCPVMIQVEGHSMIGFGYEDAGSTIYIHDTWDYNNHSMSWGGYYLGMKHYGVTVLRLNVIVVSFIYVSQDGTCDGKWPCYSTIQSAIDAAAPASVVKIQAGTYTEKIDLNLSHNDSHQAGRTSSLSPAALMPPTRVEVENVIEENHSQTLSSLEIDRQTGCCVVIDYIDAPDWDNTGLAWDNGYLWVEEGSLAATYPGTILKIDTSGNIVSYFDAPGQSSQGPHPHGLAFDGTYLRSLDFLDDKIYSLSKSGDVMGSIPAPTPNYYSNICAGLAWDGTNLWTTERYTYKIYRLNPDNGKILLSFNAPEFEEEIPNGLAWDGAHLWVSNNNGLYMLDPITGSVLISCNHLRLKGLTWDGQYIWAGNSGSYILKIYVPMLDKLTISGGWDPTFTTQSSITKVSSLTIANRSVTVDNLVIQ